MKKILSILILTLYLNPFAVFAQSPFGDPVVTDPGSATGVGQVQGTGGTLGSGTTTNNPNANQSGTGTNPGNGTTATSSGLLPTGTGSGNANTTGQAQNVGNYINAGHGQTISFWDYLWGQVTNSGSLNQSNDKNQDTKVEYTQTGAADITQGPLSSSYVTPTPTKTAAAKTSTFSCSASGTKSLGQYFKTANCIMYLLIPIVIAMMLLWFFFGAFKYASSNGEEARTEYKTYLMWAVVILFVALSFVGILRLLSKTTGL